MDMTKEAALEATLDTAVEEAVNEYDEDEQMFTEEAIAGDDDVEAEEELASSGEESEDNVEVEAAEAGDEQVEEKIEEALSEIEWNGNPDELPSDIVIDGKKYDLTKTYKAMQAGFTKKMQEVAERDRAREETHKQQLAWFEAQKANQRVVDDPRPANPTADMSEEQQEKRWDEVQRWVSRDEQRNMIRDGTIPDPERVNRMTAEAEQRAVEVRRVALLESQPGWSDQAQAKMIEIAETNQYWANSLQTDEGAVAFFNAVKTQMDAEAYKAKAAELENAKVKHSASAAQRATPAQPTQKKAVAKSPADNFKDMAFEDKIEASIRESFDL